MKRILSIFLPVAILLSGCMQQNDAALSEESVAEHSDSQSVEESSPEPEEAAEAETEQAKPQESSQLETIPDAQRGPYIPITGDEDVFDQINEPIVLRGGEYLTRNVLRNGEYIIVWGEVYDYILLYIPGIEEPIMVNYIDKLSDIQKDEHNYIEGIGVGTPEPYYEVFAYQSTTHTFFAIPQGLPSGYSSCSVIRLNLQEASIDAAKLYLNTGLLEAEFFEEYVRLVVMFEPLKGNPYSEIKLSMPDLEEIDVQELDYYEVKDSTD